MGQPFGVLPDGRSVERFTLRNASGIEVGVINYGGTIVSLHTPDRDGAFADIVLGCDGVDDYLAQSAYFGAIVGRYANRIAKGRFTLEGREYTLPANSNGQHLHGGDRGFDKRVWDAEPFAAPGAQGLRLSRESPEGEEGYPGRVRVTVEYLLTDRGTLEIDYRADTDAPTPINLSQHSYFNLAGHDSGDVLDHVLRLHASAYTPIDADLIPTGAIAPVEKTPFDFREARAIGSCLEEDDEQLERGHGYDHNFVLDRADEDLRPAADLLDPRSGRTLMVATTEPGIQFYSGNFLDGRTRGKGGYCYGPRAGLCLETQHYPDSPNQPAFPTTIVTADRPYHSRTVFTFGTQA